jgi:molybdopterin-guanine dinucleotide biosynthesis adapter protein
MGTKPVTPPLFGIVGWKNSGKTTLMAKIIENFVGRSLQVAAVKHAHHTFDVDQEGRDSHRYRAAGASTVAVSSAKRFAIMTELRNRPEPTLDELVRHIEIADIILVEGFKAANHPKLEVRRREASRPPLAPNDPTILAVAADFKLEEATLPCFALDDIDAIAAFILGVIQPQEKGQNPCNRSF